jgi:glycine dehydrogenase subunit 1
VPFIPHTEEDVRAMCAAIGVDRIEDLFDEIPSGLKTDGLMGISAGMSEMEVARLMQERAGTDGPLLNFIGAGAYEHHIPAAVWQIATRGEFYSAYTPYQAEASQGTLQLLYEFQSMMAALTGLDANNASLYDGASALAEAVLMAVRLHKSSRRVLLPAGVNPTYRRVVASIVSNQRIELVDVPYSAKEGRTSIEALETCGAEALAAMVIPQPNYFGVLEEVDLLTDWAHSRGAFAIACVNPTALALLKAPGQWGTQGADIVVGEGQPLGVPLANGGPYFGFMACKQALVRQMPGRIVGRTVDIESRPGFTLTLQAREQHIRRSKATSNICTNQGLAVTAATIYMAMLGGVGLKNVAACSHANLLALLQRLTELREVSVAFAAPAFHEAVIRLPLPVSVVLERLRIRGILGGLDLSADYPELGNAMLVCTTETKTQADLEAYARALDEAIAAR